MAVVYLDDSGTHGGSPIIAMAGYFFAAAEWEAFEPKAALHLKRHHVPVFHAKEFNNRGPKTPFAGWGIGKQLGFIDGWFEIAKAHALRGITIALPKATYESTRKETRKNQNVSAYGQCFSEVLVELRRDEQIWSLIEQEGLTVILELGNRNNEGVKQLFHSTRRNHGLEKELKAIGECAKEDCVAIQLADCLAFYSWHFAVTFYAAPDHKHNMSPVLQIAKEKVKTIGQLGVSFAANPARRKRSTRQG